MPDFGNENSEEQLSRAGGPGGAVPFAVVSKAIPEFLGSLVGAVGAHL